MTDRPTSSLRLAAIVAAVATVVGTPMIWGFSSGDEFGCLISELHRMLP